jgi:hypothetical protein
MPFGFAPPKYYFVFWSLLHLPLALFASGINPGLLGVPEEVKMVRSKLEAVLIALAFTLAMIGGTYIRDRIILRKWSPLIFSANLYIPLFVGLSLGLLYLILSRAKINLRGWQTLVALLVFSNAGLLTGVGWAQAKLRYSTTYNYGQLGMADTVAYIRSHTSPDDIISSMKDVGLMSERRYYENYGAFYEQPLTDKLIDNLETGKIRYAVFTQGNGEDQLDTAPALEGEVERTCELVAQFGNYLIYEPKYWLSKRNCP